MEVCNELKNALRASIEKSSSDSILLSGGVDSSIIALNSKVKYGITIAYGDAPDLRFARMISKKCGIEHDIKNVKRDDILESIHEVISIMRTFDPMEVRNSVVLHLAMKELEKRGKKSVLTGDGSDELFAGYNYLLRFDHDRLEKELKRLWKIMRFSSIVIGKKFGIDVKSPFLDNDFMDIAMKIPVELKVREWNGRKYGKWILRKCFEDQIGEIAWREKMPLEQGSGISIISIEMPDNEYNKGCKDCEDDMVKIRSKEHLYYYRIYRSIFGVPKEMRCKIRCSDCLACLDDERFCRTCGAFPVRPLVSN